jgi:hypothetical protein
MCVCMCVCTNQVGYISMLLSLSLPSSLQVGYIHVKTLSTGVCIELNYRPTWPCGSRTGDPPLCFQDIGGASESACVTSCTNTAHYENTSTGVGEALDTGKCTEKACEDRTVNTTGSISTPCGSGACYYDQGNTETADTCSTTCTNPNHFVTQDSNHSCVLSECSLRTANSRLVDLCVPICLWMYLFVYLCVYLFECVYIVFSYVCLFFGVLKCACFSVW